MNILIIALTLGVGCFSAQTEAPVEEQKPPTPAAQAAVDLTGMRARLDAMPVAERSAMRAAGALLIADDLATRAAVGLVLELRQGMEPLQRIDRTFRATAPSLVARIDALGDALSIHHSLLASLQMTPIPSAEPHVDSGAPDAAVVEAAVSLETATDGQWPMKRVFTAYTLELEAIRDEAEVLAACGRTCPDGVAAQAAALQQVAGHLVDVIGELAELLCAAPAPITERG